MLHRGSRVHGARRFGLLSAASERACEGLAGALDRSHEGSVWVLCYGIQGLRQFRVHVLGVQGFVGGFEVA